MVPRGPAFHRSTGLRVGRTAPLLGFRRLWLVVGSESLVPACRPLGPMIENGSAVTGDVLPARSVWLIWKV